MVGGGRAELLAREQAARLVADAAQDRLALLLEASNLVAVTGSRQQLLDQVVVLGRGAGRPRFTEADVPVIEELSRRLAVGMANAETFAWRPSR